MLHSILNAADQMGLVSGALAHCDIPCGIYDPGSAQIAALSVTRLIDVMNEGASKEAGNPVALHNLLARNAIRKEEEAEKVKHEVRIIWGDYFKAPQIEKHPNIHALVHQIMQKASACKQGVNRADAEALVDLVNQFAEIFWDTKNVATERRVCPYPPALEIVYPRS